MATEAQIAANRRNAESSTGPRTAGGKSRASANATHFGIYSAHDFVRPEDTGVYDLFCEAFQKDLVPQGALEQTLAAEIVHAAWRLRRCSTIESETDTVGQLSVDRARAESQRHLLRATAELRRLQTERQIRLECLPPDFDTSKIGCLTSFRDVEPIVVADLRRKALQRRIDHNQTHDAILRAITLPVGTPATKRTQSEPPAAPPIPRSQPCPCGSGLKYKRCCGQNAPAVLQSAA